MMQDAGEALSVCSARTGTQGNGVSRAAALAKARAEWRAKWPAEVRHVNQNNNRPVKAGATVFEGYRALVLPDRRVRFEWRSLAGVGFWVTAKDAPVFTGKTLPEATLKFAEWAMERGSSYAPAQSGAF
jgi:hypothetical protein